MFLKLRVMRSTNAISISKKVGVRNRTLCVCVCARALEEVVLENAASVSKSLVSWALVSSACMLCVLILRFLPEGIAVGLCCAFLPFQEPPVFPECVRRGECGRRCCRVLYACVFFWLKLTVLKNDFCLSSRRAERTC